MTAKTDISRFQIHDELTAPDASAKLLQGMASAGGSVSKFVGVLAGSPAALRGYARFRSELRHGSLELATIERIALAVAEHYDSQPGIAMHSRMARTAGLGLDEVASAREFDSRDPRHAALLSYLKALVDTGARPPIHLHEEAREAGWDDEQLLEAIAYLTLESFTAMINVAGEVPVDGSVEESRAAALRAA
jgi:alkylhydroperoxidase family enzyme